MRREEAKAILEEEAEFLYGNDKPHNRIAFDMAISALSENKGEWIKTKDQYGTYHFTCSKCGNDIATKSDAWDDNFCSECGADMRGETWTNE